MLQEHDTPSIAEFVGNQPVSWLCDKAGISVSQLCERIGKVQRNETVRQFQQDYAAAGSTPAVKKKTAKKKPKAKAQVAASTAVTPSAAPKSSKGKKSSKKTSSSTSGAKSKAGGTKPAAAVNNIGNARMISALPATLSQISVKLHRNKADCTTALRRMQNEGLVLVDKDGDVLTFRAAN